MSTPDLPPTIDANAAQAWAARSPTTSPWLHEEVAKRMLDRLQWIKLQPKAWVHWHAMRGGGHAALAQRLIDADCTVVESDPRHAAAAAANLTRPWWQPWRKTTAVQTTPPPDAVDMVWANMLLHTVANPQALMAQWHKALAVNGFVMFSCLGPDTTKELRQHYQAQGWPPMGHEFTDMHDWGDMLVQAGFAEPVMDVERITLTYSTPAALLAELREWGRNLHPHRFPALRGRGWPARIANGGPQTLTIELIFGHALKAAPRVRMSEQSSVSLEDMRRMLRS